MRGRLEKSMGFHGVPKLAGNVSKGLPGFINFAGEAVRFQAARPDLLCQ
jgi:hypothetical protein